MPKIDVIPENIPQDLKELNQWVLWRYELRDGKKRKPPYQPDSNLASTTDSSTWSTFEQVVSAYETGRWDGIGCVFTGREGLVGFDLDDCLQNGQPKPWAAEIVSRLNSYTEITPSGTGLRVIVRATMPQDGYRKKTAGADGEIEVYQAKRYFTCTGNLWDSSLLEIEARQEEATAFYQQYGPKQKEQNSDTSVGISLLDDDTLLAKARAAQNGDKFSQLFDLGDTSSYPSPSEADLALCNILAFWTSKDPEQMDRLFRESALMRDKWDHGNYGANTIHKALEGTENIYMYTQPIHGLTNAGMAKRLVKRHGKNIRYSHPTKQWYIWNGQCWEKDSTGAILRLAKDAVSVLDDEAKRETNEERKEKILKYARTAESARSLKDMIYLAQSEPGIAVTPEDFDTNPWLLSVKNGTLDPRTGILREHRREDLITHCLPVCYDPDAKAPTWEAFLKRVTGENLDLIEFLQRVAGYCLTGSVKEQAMFILHGTGANGKSVFLSTLQRLMGPYAWTASPEMFLARGYSPHATTRAALCGKRLVVAVEIKSGRELDTATVKWLTGGDQISANFMHTDEFVFDPTHKIFLATNALPAIRENDHAIWRRIYCIHFKVTIPEKEQDKDLSEKLKEELPGILTWAVRGCMEWQRNGLQPPKEVLEDTQQYREDENQLQRFLNECCSTGPRKRVGSTDLYKKYAEWCNQCGEDPIYNKNTMGRALRALGYDSIKSNGNMYRKGIALEESSP